MSQSEKAAYYKALKKAGMEFDRHYREYSTEELKSAYDRAAAGGLQLDPVAPASDPTGYPGANLGHHPNQAPQAPQAVNVSRGAPVRPRDPNELAGQRLNTHPRPASGRPEPLRVDPETGYTWYQEEVRKPAFAKPRGRRVLQYMDTGVQVATAKDGDYVESFEVAGQGVGRPSEVKVTLPSYQVGIYADPRFPWLIYVYNEKRGFDFFEVNNYFGGEEMVPPACKRMYVENVLCYDMRSVIGFLSEEYRKLQLANRI